MENLLLDIKKSGIRINVNGENLDLKIPKGFQNDSLLEKIKLNKIDLIQYIGKSKGKRNKTYQIPKGNSKSAKLTPSQLRMFLAEGMAKGSNVYNIPFAYELLGEVDVQQLEKAFNGLIKRHESLRTHFLLNEAHEPIQRIQQKFDFELESTSCTEKELEKIKADFSYSFDLGEAPLLRAKLLQLNSNKYVLLVDIHHIVFDGVSMKVFIEELFSLYHNESLPKLDLNYIDYANWLNGEDYEEVLTTQKSFWLTHLDGYSNNSSLPFDFKKQQETSFEGNYFKYLISADRKQTLLKIARKYKISLYTLLTSLYGILEAKLTNKEDVVVGTPVAGRRHWSIEKMVGMFVNTLGIRLLPNNDFSFTEYLENARLSVMQSFDHQEYPYETLVDDLGLSGNKDNNPLFNTLVTLVNFAEDKEFSAGDLTVRPMEFDKSTSKFDLSVYFVEHEKGIDCTFECNSHLFKEDTIQKFFDYLINIIDQVSINESIKLKEISLLDEDATNQLISLNDFTKVDYPKDKTLVDMFEAQVDKTPNNVALVFGDNKITYEALNKEANKLARLLRSKGVGANNAVGLLMEKNSEVVVSMLGILKAGGAYVPIDVAYPEDRIDYIIENSQIKWVLSTPEYSDLVKNKHVEFLNVEESNDYSDTSDLEKINQPGDLCYVIYTSGTTGKPKGVMVEHKNVVRLLFNDEFQFDFGEEDVWTMFHSHCFDFTVWEMYGPLLYGGKLVIVSKEDAMDPSKYIDILKKHKVTVLNQTPTAFYSLSQACETDNINIPDIRYVIFGGEALAPIKLKSWRSEHPQAKLINMYGITEITVHASYKEINDFEIENNISNIGKAICTSSFYLLNGQKQHVPVGVIGEIYVGGEGVARGYMNNPELSSSRFVNNPFNSGETIYRTGDLAVMHSNGDLEYKGRIDRQVQLRGFRIELSEIETHLMQYEFISDVVVNMAEDAQEDPYLCAYYMADKILELSDLRSYLESKLPYYMVPSYFVRVDEFPFTSNNKIDFSKLPTPLGGSSEEIYIKPTNNLEREVCSVWEQCLGINQIGLKDNFFALGGDSLKAIGLIAKINKLLSTKLSIADLYSHPTIKELLNLAQVEINKQENSALDEAIEEVHSFQERYKQDNDFPDIYEEVYPMNGVEKGMVFYSLQTKSDDINDILYHEQNLYDMPIKNFNFEIFKRATHLLCTKHSELRKIFDLDNMAHIIMKEIEPEINFIDLLHLSKDEQEYFISQKMHEEKLRGTELSMSLIWRMNVIKIRGDYQYLLFDFNHSLFDGWSLSSFLTELQKTYLKLVENKDYTPTNLLSNYRDQILSEIVASKDESSISYWKTELDGYTRYELPATGEAHVAAREVVKFSQDFRKELEALAKQQHTSFKHLCFSAYLYSLRMLSYDNDITTGMATNIRPLIEDGEQLLGCFLNTIPFRAKIPENLSWVEYIQFIESKLKTLKYHERVPFHKILEIADEGRSEKNPIFDVFFNYIDFRVFEEMESSDKDIVEEETTLEKEYMNDHALCTTSIFAQGNDFIFALLYSTTFLTELQAKELTHYFRNTLKAFIYSPNELMNKQLIAGKNFNESNLVNTKVPYPADATLVSLFEEQVDKTPDNVAIVFEKETMTYSELNNLSNAIAAQLRAQGVTRDSIVGLYLDKNLNTVACQLGILKSGGCYLPIDPGYPIERINYIIEDSKLNVLVTNSVFEASVDSTIMKLNVDDIAISSSGTDIENLDRINQPDDLCYVIYTSGTTGKPKGVMVEHKNAIRLFFNEEFQFEFGEDDVWTMFHSHCFDFSVWEMYGALLYGGKLVMVSEETARDPYKYMELLQTQKVTVLNQTPTAFDSLRNACSHDEVILSDLRYVIFGGEALTPLKLKDWYVSHPNVKMVNMYGITEVTVHTTYKEIGLDEIESNISNIGTPIPTTSIYLLDSNKNLQPVGAIGEMYVSGLGVARGYLNKEELTSSRFIENPFCPGDRLYKSGDLGRLLENGEIEYLGRIDNQVQLKGFRIELKEIEYNLLCHQDIEEVIVILNDDNKSQPYLCAYYVSDKTQDLDELRTYLGKFLPTYMIPSHFVELDEVPFTSNNKIDVKKLPAPLTTISQNSYVAPKNNREKQACEIWEKELGVAKVGTQDNYFSLGGDSLRAIGLISSLNKELNISLTIADLYSYQTVEKLMSIQEIETSENKLAREEAKEEVRLFQESYKANNEFPDSFEEVYPMNGVEMGMVFHSLQTKSENIHEILYHEQNLYDMPIRDFCFDRFTKAVHLLCQKHDGLRKIFDLDNLAHIVKKDINPEINFIDICNLDKEEQEIYMNKIMHEGKLKGTELSFSLIWRMNVIKIRDDYQYLLFDFNHALFDGWSLSSFLTELQKTYLLLKENEEYIPEPLLSSYYDQILGELFASKKESSVAYWQQELEGYTRFELHDTGIKHEAIRDEFDLGKDFRKKLEAVAQEHNTSFKHLCFSAYIYMLRLFSYGNDITAGITTNVRPLVPDGEQLLGCFLNTIPFRAIIPKGITWAEYINLIESKLRTLKYHEQAPFHKILEMVEEVSTEKNPIFDVSFNYVDFRIFNELQPTEETIEAEETNLSKAYMNDYALLGMNVIAFNEEFKVELNYSTSFVTHEQSVLLFNCFKNILEHFIDDTESVINKGQVLKESKKDLKTAETALGVSVKYNQDKTVLDLFKGQVAKDPNTAAIIFGEEQLTYLDLDSISDLWASKLISSGIKPGGVIGLTMSRSSEMIIAILAVMKAGAAYMPINPDLPATRMAHMIKESTCELILTNLNGQPVDLGSVPWININQMQPNSSTKGVDLPIVDEKDIAYILYTSGSTGKPKGCMISHANLFNYINWSNNYYFENTEQGNWGLMTPMSFDLSVTAVFSSLTRGKKLYLYNEKDRVDQLLKNCFNNPDIDTLKITPTHVSVLKDLAIKNTNIRTVICGGEQLHKGHLEILKSINENIKVYNEYGPTETTVGCTAAEVKLTDEKITVGGPIANTEILVLDAHRNTVPAGIVGEIYVKGAGVSNGYVGNISLTTERFIKINGDVCYKTGDFGRLLANGELEYLNRLDGQIKLRGYRIELGEIENVLMSHPDISSAIVIKKEYDHEACLVAYYVNGSNTSHDLEELKGHMLMNLPGYMVPSYFKEIKQLPLTSNGKLDKDSLPEPEVLRTDSHVDPANSTEEMLLIIWSDILKIDKDRISVTTSFFNIGGNSLKAITLANAIQREFLIEIAIKDIFELQTIRAIADFIITDEQLMAGKQSQLESAKVII